MTRRCHCMRGPMMQVFSVKNCPNCLKNEFLTAGCIKWKPNEQSNSLHWWQLRTVHQRTMGDVQTNKNNRTMAIYRQPQHLRTSPLLWHDLHGQESTIGHRTSPKPQNSPIFPSRSPIETPIVVPNSHWLGEADFSIIERFWWKLASRDRNRILHRSRKWTILREGGRRYPRCHSNFKKR